jgi:hypothetical protein
MPIIWLRRCLKCPSFHKCASSGYTALPCKLPKQKAARGLYYDLIRVPHGHIPAPKTNLWSHFPMPVKEFRDYGFFHCPECRRPSFFSINGMCMDCEEEISYLQEEGIWRRGMRRRRRKYFKGLLKRIEYVVLPFLVLTGKAWYVHSVRHHFSDYDEHRLLGQTKLRQFSR